ncbi:uncharacterized protein LOC115992108 [Quercus lobata]|uniref:uncharacterized protein LOC115992108 n=1 Tax=Quercus lobata TaxID=97700 RepID=UPI001243A9E8|nr:uncharacterized protein LOC115992108 [Quercus lobata]
MPKKEVQAGTSDGYRQSRLCPLLNGAVLPSSPLKAQSEILDRPVGKVCFASHQFLVTCDNVLLENGDCDIQKPVQHHQRLTENAECEGEVLLSNSAKLTQIKGSTGSLVSVDIKDEKEVLVVEGGKEVLGRSTLQVPHGIPFSCVSVGGACRAFPLARTDSTGSYDSGGLLDTEVLRERMQLIAAAQGLQGVSMECANLLINGLDAYLKKLIKSCVELVGARCGHDLSKNNSYKHQFDGKHFPISLLDFKVAMELNPHQLGGDWAFLLEKICIHVFDQ